MYIQIGISSAVHRVHTGVASRMMLHVCVWIYIYIYIYIYCMCAHKHDVCTNMLYAQA